jgi:molybdenum cofactor biosynthesis protein B
MMSDTTKKHKAGAPKKLGFAIFTDSTSRYEQMKKGVVPKDASGDLIESLLENAGHAVVLRKTISDDQALIKESVTEAKSRGEVDAAIFCGGTGITHSDVTIETMSPLLEKTLPGFGEIFRKLSYNHIGSSAVLSRAVAGVTDGKAFFCIPGSPDAVKICVEKLILPESGHILKHARE